MLSEAKSDIRCPRSFVIGLFLLLTPYFLPLTPAFAVPPVYILRINGTINPVVADYLDDGLKEALAQNAQAVIIQLDTPGGLMDSMHQIIRGILNVPLPVIIFVGPSGARAASAGVFITMAADIAVMAPGTNIGAAHPVQLGGMGGEKMSKEMGEKIVQDASAYIKAIAEDKNRNWQWAQLAVTKSKSISAEEALKKNVVEYISPDLQELRKILDGKSVKKKGKEFILKFKDAEFIERPMKKFRQFLDKIAHPNVAYILLLLGIYGLIYELMSPGIGFGGAVGAICLILAFFALQILPTNLAGLLLLILGVGLMLLDLVTPTYGILTAGGVVAFVLGSIMLFKTPERTFQVSMPLIISLTACSAAFFVFAIGAAIKIRFRPATTGQEGLVGLRGVVRKKLVPQGLIFVHGEIWRAKAEEGNILKGKEVEVVGVEGNLLKVKQTGNR